MADSVEKLKIELPAKYRGAPVEADIRQSDAL
jgi:hypothetical protein